MVFTCLLPLPGVISTAKLYLAYTAFCWAGLKHSPVYVQCSDRVKVLPKEGHSVYKHLSVQRAREVFVECCEFAKHQPDTELWNARSGEFLWLQRAAVT